MISGNWDLWILDPVFILFGIIAIFYMCWQERLSWKWLVFFLETILYWFANGVLAKWNTTLMNAPGWLSSPAMIAMIFFATGLFFSIILKPLATWSTGLAHHRRWWMYGSIGATALGLALTMVHTVVPTGAGSIVLFIVVGLLVGMSISSNSLYFLFANEQFYYRIAPALTAALLSVTTLFGTFVGDYAMTLENVLHATKNNIEVPKHIALFVVTMIMLLGSVGCIFVNVENPETVRGFDQATLSQLPEYNVKRLMLLVISTAGISAFFALSQSSLVTDFIETKLLIWHNFDEKTVDPWIRTFTTFNTIPQILFGYLIYRYITKNIGFKQTMIMMIAFALIASVVLIFTANPYLFIFFNLIIGIATTQVFFSFFSMAIMWNYRSNGFPVTGFTSAANSLGQFVVQVIINSLRTEHVGIYSSYDKLSTMSHDQIIAFNSKADDVTTILFAGIVVCLVIAELWIFFTSKEIFADYLDIKTANANMKKILRLDVNHKIETRIAPSTLEMSKYNEWK